MSKETIFDKTSAFEFDRNREKMFGVKSAIVWAYSNKSNSCSPALYITKPKHVSQSDYDLMLEKIKIAFEQ